MMSVKEKEIPSGEPDQKDKDSSGDTPNHPEGAGDDGKVSYDTYKKLLSEKKKVQSELDKIRKETDEIKRKELESQNQYKELYESSKTETEKLKETLKGHEERWQDALKLNAFNAALGDTKRIEPKFYGFIDTSKILVDPETNKVDPVSVQKEVNRVNREYPEIIKSTVKGSMPSESPTGGQTLTYEAWKKLQLKEKKSRMKEVKD